MSLRCKLYKCYYNCIKFYACKFMIFLKDKVIFQYMKATINNSYKSQCDWHFKDQECSHCNEKKKNKTKQNKTTKPSVLYIFISPKRRFLFKKEVNRSNFRASPPLSYGFSRSTLHIKKENEYKLF